MTEELDPTELVEVSDDRESYNDYDGYYETYGDLVTEATGKLREMVLDKVQFEGDREGVSVTITEHHWNSGYCETCSSPETDFIIKVAGDEVYTASGWMRGNDTSFGALQNWLTSTEEEDA